MEQARENKLGIMPVGKLLFSVSLPIVASMLVQAMYNVVDSLFVARFDETGEALAAVSLVFPVQNLMIAFGVGTAVGMASLLGRRLGEKNFDSANRAASNGVFLALATTLAFVLGGLLLSGRMFAGYASNPDFGPNVAEYAAGYMRIVTVGSFGLFQAVIFERLLQSTGKSLYSMLAQMTGAVVNIVLDPIMIFGLLGFPRMGVAGAALATVIGQWCGMAVGIFLHFTRNREIKVTLRGFRPSAKTIKHIYQVGLPSIVMQSVGSVMTFGMNLILATFGGAQGQAAVAVFGVYFKLQSFIFMPVFGFNSGMIPIIAYNFGAKKPDRMRQTVRLAMMVCFGIMVAGLALFWLIPELMFGLFTEDGSTLELGVQALQRISLHFPLAAISIVCSGFFQAVGSGVNSLITSVIRQLIFLMPAAFVLARMFGLGAVWFAFPLAEVVALFISVLLFLRTWRRRVQPLETAAGAV